MPSSFRTLLLSASLVALAGFAAAPSTAEAQFGGLKKLKNAVDKAKQVKETADSAKSVVNSVTGGDAATPAAAALVPGAGAATATNFAALSNEVWAKFAAGFAVEKSAGNPATGMLSAVSTSGLSIQEYQAIKIKMVLYNGAKKNRNILQTVLPPEDIPVFDAHQAQISQLLDS